MNSKSQYEYSRMDPALRFCRGRDQEPASRLVKPVYFPAFEVAGQAAGTGSLQAEPGEAWLLTALDCGGRLVLGLEKITCDVVFIDGRRRRWRRDRQDRAAPRALGLLPGKIVLRA